MENIVTDIDPHFGVEILLQGKLSANLDLFILIDS